MPPSLPPLTLIVATTPSLGIGLRGTLPWPTLKSDLAFFAKVTKRASPFYPGAQRTDRNAVIMGRKTWESIPLKFRPLKERINVVISRTPEKLDLPKKERGVEAVMAVGSLEEGLRELQKKYNIDNPPFLTEAEDSDEDLFSGTSGISAIPGFGLRFGLGRVFVIGGAEIYAQALEMACCERILWTKLSQEFECDTFFPAGALPRNGEVGDGEERGGEKWVMKDTEDWKRWTGIRRGFDGVQREGDVEFQVFMAERPYDGDKYIQTNWWTGPEIQDFHNYVRHFGTDWAQVAERIRSKTPNIVSKKVAIYTYAIEY